MSKKVYHIELLNSLISKVLNGNPLCLDAQFNHIFKTIKQSSTMKKQFIIPFIVVQGLIPMTIFCTIHNGFAEAFITLASYVFLSITIVMMGAKEQEIPMSVTYKGKAFNN